LLSLYLAYNEIAKPSGLFVVDLPDGVVAWEPSRLSNAEKDVADLLIAEQTSAGIVASFELGLVSPRRCVDELRSQRADSRSSN